MAIPDNFLPTFIRRTENAISAHFVELPRGFLVEDVMDPALWVHIARKLAVNDTITVVEAAGAFDVELRVIQVDPAFLWAKTRVLRTWASDEALQAQAFPTAEYNKNFRAGFKRERAAIKTLSARRASVRQGPDADGYKVHWAGPIDKFRIFNVPTGAIVEKGFATRGDAVAALGLVKQALAAL